MPSHAGPVLSLNAVAQVQALAAAERLLVEPPVDVPAQPLQQLDDGDRTRLLAEVAAPLTGLPAAPVDDLTSLGSVPALGPEDIDQLFNDAWLNALDA